MYRAHFLVGAGVEKAVLLRVELPMEHSRHCQAPCGDSQRSINSAPVEVLGFGGRFKASYSQFSSNGGDLLETQTFFFGLASGCSHTVFYNESGSFSYVQHQQLEKIVS